MQECRIISLALQKGGCSKSCSTYNLAALKAQEGKRVLMVDLDPQASLTIMTGIEPGEDRLEGHSTCDLFDAKKDPIDSIFHVDPSGLEDLYIVPSDISLAETEKELILRMNGEVKLKKALDKIRQYFDMIFVDCPPQLGLLTINAMVASDEIVIPCKTDYVSYRGVQALLNTVQQIMDEDMNDHLRVDGIIGTFYEANVKDQRTVLDMLAEKEPILGTIRKSADINRHTVEGKPVVLAMPSSKVAEEYKMIAEKL